MAAFSSLMNLHDGSNTVEDNCYFSYFQPPPSHFCLAAEGDWSVSKESEAYISERDMLPQRHSFVSHVSSVELHLNKISNSNEDSPSYQSRQSFQENAASISSWLQSVMSKKEGEFTIADISLERTPIPSWENVVKQDIPCHLYTSELTSQEVPLNVIDEDPHMFRSLYESSGVVSEYDFVQDLLDLLIGIPSSTFVHNKIQKKFQLKSQARLSHLSHESTLKFCESYIEAGIIFHELKSFSTEGPPVPSAKGLVLRGFKNGIKEILNAYMEYIVSVKTNKPTMLLLRKDVYDNAELLNTLGSICGLSAKGNNLASLPKGLGLLSHLNKVSQSYHNREHAVLVAVLLKFAYSPYFEFLNTWMTTGVCCDANSEFQILEDCTYLERKDELYWKFAYTNIKDDTSRIIPSELEKYSHDILQCGKSMRLLQSCCPQLLSLEFMSRFPPPRFSMLFSHRATDLKKVECSSYILQKEGWETKEEKELFMPEIDSLVERQATMGKDDVFSQVQRRWNGCKISPKRTSSILSLNKKAIPKRCKSFPDITTLVDATEFSGIAHEIVGILFVGTFKKDISLDTNQNKQSGLHLCESKSSRQEKSASISRNLMVNDKKNSTCASQSFTFGSFSSALASLLLSEYNDTVEAIYSCLQLTSLQNLIQYNFSAVMSMRMHLVQKTIVDYVINELKLKELLLCLKNTYFLQDECFSQSIGKRLFHWAMKCETLNQFADWSNLNQMLARSVAVPSLARVSFLETASVNFVIFSPEEFISKKNKFMHYFNFEFKIEWPLNIIINKNCIQQYSKIFSFIMEMEFLCWQLAKIWRLLLNIAKENNLENSPHYRKLMLDRFNMHQFIRVLRNCIHQDLGGPLWEYLEKTLVTKEISIDALENIHKQYLEKAMARCFLTPETAHLHEVLEFLFEQVEKFCRAALDCKWKKCPYTGHYESSEFETLYDSYSKYHKLKESFYERMMKIVRRKTLQRLYDEHYQLYLETILETNKNM